MFPPTDTLSSPALTALTALLSLPSPSLTHALIAHFSAYLTHFLRHQDPTLVLDPHLPQITLRLALASAHPEAGWPWTTTTTATPDGQGPDEHAALFVRRVLRDMIAGGYDCGGGDGDHGAAVRKVHTWLCVLQSLWLGNGVWVEEGEGQGEWRAALLEVLERMGAKE
ncbi:hypothetical protein VTK26DRAFT_6018 [Humicola hyalothermophila]